MVRLKKITSVRDLSQARVGSAGKDKSPTLLRTPLDVPSESPILGALTPQTLPDIVNHDYKYLLHKEH